MNCLNIKINVETLVDLLVERVSFWTEDKREQELFKKYYENNIDWISQVDDTGGFDVNYIVDNDYINNFHIVNGKENLEEYEKEKIEETIEDKENNKTLFLINDCL